MGTLADKLKRLSPPIHLELFTLYRSERNEDSPVCGAHWNVFAQFENVARSSEESTTMEARRPYSVDVGRSFSSEELRFGMIPEYEVKEEKGEGKGEGERRKELKDKLPRVAVVEWELTRKRRIEVGRAQLQAEPSAGGGVTRFRRRSRPGERSAHEPQRGIKFKFYSRPQQELGMMLRLGSRRSKRNLREDEQRDER